MYKSPQRSQGVILAGTGVIGGCAQPGMGAQTESGSSRRAESTLSHRTISSAPYNRALCSKVFHWDLGLLEIS